MNNLTNILLTKRSIDHTEALTISAAGFYNQIKDHEIYRKRGEIAHDCIVIYCTKGEGWLVSEATQYKISPGMLVFCDKSVPHAYGANPANPWQIYWAHFSGPMAEFFTHKTGLSGLACTLKLKDMATVLPYLETMLDHAADATDDIERLTAYGALRMALLQTIRQIIDTHHDHYSPLILHGIEVMKAHINDRLDLDHISKAIGSSKYHFIRAFKQQVGQSPMHYYNHLKIEEAKKLLITTNRTIDEISKIFSFNTPFYFSETFKRYTGFSPRHYRQQHKMHY